MLSEIHKEVESTRENLRSEMGPLALRLYTPRHCHRMKLFRPFPTDSPGYCEIGAFSGPWHFQGNHFHDFKKKLRGLASGSSCEGHNP